MKLHIGIDDTDSPKGGCTTYIAALLVEKLESLGARFIDYPNLIRLNPNAPWKTRGNGAVCLRIESNPDLREDIKREVVRTVEQNSDLSSTNTDPGIVLYEGQIPLDLRDFSRRTITGIVEIEEALSLIEKLGALAFDFGPKRGLIGALAAVGEPLLGDHTYEYLAYREPENCGTKRLVKADSVFEMDRVSPLTFNNIDAECRRVLITPHGPDPILFGIRGESPEAVYDAARMVVAEEPVERWVIFRTNQGTDAHLVALKHIADLRPCNPAIIEGTITRAPRIISGGHVILGVGDGTGEIDCAAYEPTGTFRETVKILSTGDFVRIGGGTRGDTDGPKLTLNMERLEILRLVPKVLYLNPSCPMCQTRMESLGRNQGFRCRRCGFLGPEMKKEAIVVRRNLEPGLYLPPPHAQRHLTKPLKRYNREKRSSEIHLKKRWHSEQRPGQPES